MSKTHYLRCKLLHSLPEFTSKTKNFQVGNGQYVNMLFIIPVTLDIHDHKFEIFTLVSDIHENADLILGIKHIIELEGIINFKVSCFRFSNRSFLFFTKDQVTLKPRNKGLLN